MKLKQWLPNGQKSASKCAKIGCQMGGNRPPNGQKSAAKWRPRLIYYVFNSLIKLWPPSLSFFNKTSATKLSIL
jgi:hypothetical protein